MTTFDKITEDVCKRICETLQKKNHDYGDSFFNQVKKHGDLAAILRIEEKTDRWNSLIKSEAMVDESIDDTLLDLAGYAILTLVTHERIKFEK